VHFSRVVKPINLLLMPIMIIGAASTVHVPYETRIKVFLKDPVSPGQVQVGDRLHLIVVENVIVSGYVVFAKGADGLATVDRVSNGDVHVSFNWVHDVDGSKVGVMGEQTTSSGGGAANGDDSVDVTDAMNRMRNAVANSGSQQAQQAISSKVTQAQNTVTALFGSSGHKGPAPTAAPILPINLLVKNPNGVTVMASEHSEDDDTGVK
jgi:hypothetical protein